MFTRNLDTLTMGAANFNVSSSCGSDYHGGMRWAVIVGCALLTFDAQAEQFGDLYYGVNDSNVWIFGYTGLGGDVVIPSEIDSMPVTTIDRDAFENITSITSVTFPTSLTTIAHYAFYGCTGLANVTLPVSVTDISYGVFANCSSLTNIAISADNPAYYSLNGILYDKTGSALIQFPGGIGGSLTIAEGVTQIAGSAFLGNTGLTNVVLSETLTDIGSGAFSECNGLMSVLIPSGVSNIVPGAFGNCANLMAIEVAESNPAYSSTNGILFNYSQTILVQYPGGLAGDYDVPAGVTNISSSAFTGCAGLSDVSIPDNIKQIGPYAFFGCAGLTDVTIPNSISTIESGTFYDCSGLTNVFLPAGITNIGSGAFSGCRSLENILIPDCVTRLAWGAFQYCSALTNIVLGTGTVTIESRVFYECNNLGDIFIPASVTNLRAEAFGYCHGLTNIAVADDNPAYSSLGGVVFNKVHTSLLHFPGGFEGRYVVPVGVQSVGNDAFDQCLDVNCVELPSSCGYFGNYAFAHCTNLIGMCFNGTPPSLGIQTFLFSSNVVMYYRTSHAADWGASFADRPTAIWPEFFTAGIQPSGFVADVVASDGQEVVVEMCPDLSGAWTPVSTNVISGGSMTITAPDWTADSSRFYRVAIKDFVP